MKKKMFLLPVGWCAVAAGVHAEIDHAAFVDPFIGTGGVGHTTPAAAWPFGLVQAGPDTMPVDEMDWEHCSGYQYDDKLIYGFSQTHLSGTGCPALSDVSLMPFVRAGGAADTPGEFASGYAKTSEKASPGYYTVTLERDNIKVEITALEHVAVYRITYPDPAKANLCLYGHSANGYFWRRKETRHGLSCAADRRGADGFYVCNDWVNARHVYYAVDFSAPFESVTERARLKDDTVPRQVFAFALKAGEPLVVKVALSTTGRAGARKNLAAEMPGWDFDAARAAARAEWNWRIGAAAVTEGTDAQKTRFHTALYHTMFQPNNIADVDGQYRGADGAVAMAKEGRYFSTFSTWDTFRAAHPLYTLVAPDLVPVFVANMIEHGRRNGYLPVWTLWGKENDTMIGVHSIPVIVDAWRKGFAVDIAAAYRLMRQSLVERELYKQWDWGRARFRVGYWRELDAHGWYPIDIVRGESVSRAYEIGFDSWCAAAVARARGETADRARFLRRARAYTRLTDPALNLARGRDSQGNWRTPFDPLEIGHGPEDANDFTEGNAWHYTWHVMQEPDGLIAQMGGAEKFGAQLDRLFSQPSTVKGSETVIDVTGMIGQYVHGNEPCHHVIYFYNFINRRDRVAELVREVFDTFYQNRPDGLCGNDDCGQMSAWAVFSAAGFYPFNPCGGDYVLGAPQLPCVRFNLADGKTFTVRAKNLSAENKYVKSVTLNGAPLSGFILRHDQITAGGELVFEMRESPERSDPDGGGTSGD